MNAVVVCVENDRFGADCVSDREIEGLAAQLCSLAVGRGLGEYDGCDEFASEARLYLFSQEADALAAAVLEFISTLSWRDRVHVRVSVDPLGTAWRTIAQ